MFKKQGCEVRKTKNRKLIATDSRTSSNLYTLLEFLEGMCFMGQEEENWLWHKRLGHISFDNLIRISSKQAVRDISIIKKPTNNMCTSCQKEK